MEELGTEATELCSLAMGAAATTFRDRETLIGLLSDRGGARKSEGANFDGANGIGGFTTIPELKRVVI